MEMPRPHASRASHPEFNVTSPHLTNCAQIPSSAAHTFILHTSHIAAMDIRVLHPSDIPHVQQTNITNLPENYFCKYYMYHALSWPQLSYVAVDVRCYT